MGTVAWIGIALAAWVAASVVTGFALGRRIGRGWTRPRRVRKLAARSLVARLD